MTLTIEPPGSALTLGSFPRVVREFPRTFHELHIERPDGSSIRIAGDEPRSPLADYSFSTILPGGESVADASTLRLTDERIPKHSRARFLTADGRQVWQGRVEASPERSDDGLFDLSLVGMEKLLDDAQRVTFLGCDSSLDSWEEAPRARRRDQADNGRSVNAAFSVSVDEGGLTITMDPDRNIQLTAQGEAWYLGSDGKRIAMVQYVASEVAGAGMLTEIHSFDAFDAGSLDGGTLTTNLTVATFTPSTAAKYVRIIDKPTGAAANKADRLVEVHAATVYGDHGLPTYAIDGLPDGLKLSDILPYLTERFQPLLGIGEIEDSSFILPDAKWLDPVTLREILEEAITYEYGHTWAVWGGNLTYGRRRSMGHTWTLRRSEGARFVDSGEASEADVNGVVVLYQDRDGSVKWAGPPGSGADVEDEALGDTSPQNPVNASSVVGEKWATVDAGGLTADKAVEAGAEALAELLATRFVGEIEIPPVALRDGVWQPTSLMRADDWVHDAERGVRMPLSATTYRPGARPMTATVDLPARRLDAQIARQGIKPRKIRRKQIRRRIRQARMTRQRQRRRKGRSR